jgi:uncharacterized protein with von Willebrand factor type A (vWA) domain
MTSANDEDLPALLRQVLRELETSTDPQKLALLQRLKGGTHTPEDASDVADLIESLIERSATRKNQN